MFLYVVRPPAARAARPPSVVRASVAKPPSLSPQGIGGVVIFIAPSLGKIFSDETVREVIEAGARRCSSETFFFSLAVPSAVRRRQ